MGVLYVYVSWVLSFSVFSQTNTQFHYFIDLKEARDIFPKIRDTAELSYKLQQWIVQQQYDGYLLAGLDSIVHVKGETGVYLNKGSKYSLIFEDSLKSNFSNGGQPSTFKAFRSDKNDPISAEFRNWVLYQGDHGYPFAAAHLISLGVVNDTLLIQFHLRKGEVFNFGESEQAEKPLFKDYVFHKITDISPGSLFAHSKIQKSVQRISRLANVQQEAEPFIYFPGNTGVVRYYLKQRKSSKFDFLLGLNPYDGPNGRSYRLTGLGHLQLYNIFKLSEDIYLKYENLNDNAPKFLISLKFPYLPMLPVGIQYDLSFYRNQEVYFEFRHQAFFDYPLDMNSDIGISFIEHISDVLNPDTSFLISQMRLPPILDFHYFSVGFRLRHMNLNHSWLPTRGLKITAELHYGKKTYEAHPTLLEYESEQIKVQQQFDSLNLNNRQARFGLQFENYLELGKRSVLKMALKSEGFIGNSLVLDNERYRLGGSQNLRGFDEDFYLASAYSLASLEYRYLLDRQSYVSLFHDFSFLSQQENGSEHWNHFNGSGVGLHFTTPVGLFSLQYAVGTGPDVSFDLGKGKIHFGYSALF